MTTKGRAGYISLYDRELKEEIDGLIKQLINSGQMSKTDGRSGLFRKLIRLGLACVWSTSGETGGLPSPGAIEENLRTYQNMIKEVGESN